MKRSNKINIGRLSPAFKKNCIPIVFSINESYTKYLSVAIQSLIENSSTENCYDIIVIHTDVSEENRNLVKMQTSRFSNFSCRFVNVKNFVSKFIFKKDKRLPRETFFRLLIADLLKSYKKVIYLDSDLVVDSDIGRLFMIDVSRYYLGACRSIIDSGVCHAWYGFVWRRHHKKIKTDFDNFLNAGVLLMNLSLMRKNFTSVDLLKAAEDERYTGLDQDALNIFCKGKILFLDDKWNMICHPRHHKEAKHAPKKIYKKWKKSLANPSIYHFAGPKVFKPWLNPFDYPSEFFWKYAYKTPFYKSLVNDMIDQTKSKSKRKKMLDKVNAYISNAKSKL